MTLRTILFDLDNTLLGNDMDVFLPAYFKCISTYAADRYDPRQLALHIMDASQAMLLNTDPAVTNENAFWSRFSELTGFDHAEMTPFFTRFYQTRFNDLSSLTQHRPEARPLVEWAIQANYRTAIATNPMFPLIAVERRLVWGDLHELDFDLVTSYENMHATKPHPHYYREMLDKLDCLPAETLMVGDDWQRDIAPAAQVGLRTFWIAPADAPVPDESVSLVGQGDLTALRTWLEVNHA